MIDRLLGKLLRGRHAGDRYLLWNELATEPGEATLYLRSNAYAEGGSIPLRHAGKGVGENISPGLAWSGIPAATVELVLVMEDPDAPLRRPFVHLIAAGIEPSLTGLAEGALGADATPADSMLGLTTFRKPGYGGPRALPGHGPHRYVLQLFALHHRSGLAAGARREALAPALAGKVIGRGRLDGYFERM